jgi:DNA invertase Pin-like site-specific DNA recombinase
MSPESQPSRRIGYARVSTHMQTCDQQVEALKRAGCTRLYVDDGVSAVAKARPALEAAKAALRPGDVFVVWGIDRAFQSLTQAIDTRTPEGRKWYIDIASWAEYERAVISRRTREKMASAKRAGKHLGRPYKLSKTRVLRAHRHVTEEHATIAATAAACDVAPITIRRAFRRYGLVAA